LLKIRLKHVLTHVALVSKEPQVQGLTLYWCSTIYLY